MPLFEGLIHTQEKDYHCGFCDLRCSNKIDNLHFSQTRRSPMTAPSSHWLTCWCSRHRCYACELGFCSIAKFEVHVWSTHYSDIAPRWILRNVEAPNSEHTGWKCRICPLDTFAYDKLLQHLENKADHSSHVPAFCCLYCAEAHHTRDGLEKHMEKHSTITSPQLSLNVCVRIKHLDTFASNRNAQDAARLARHMIAQDSETGATLAVYSGHRLGEINRLFTLLQSIIFCGLHIQCTTSRTLKVAFWLQVESRPVRNATISEVTIAMTIYIIWTSWSSSSTLLDERSSRSRHEKHGHSIKS